MKLDRICKNCGNNFFAQKHKQFFCSRKCFKKDYSLKKKSEFSGKFPLYKCPKCYNSVELNFDPIKNAQRWIGFECPYCFDPDRNIQILISKEIFIVF